MTLVDQVDGRGGDGVDRPLLFAAAVAGFLNDRFLPVRVPVERLEALAALGAHELDDCVLEAAGGVGWARDRQAGDGR